MSPYLFCNNEIKLHYSFISTFCISWHWRQKPDWPHWPWWQHSCCGGKRSSCSHPSRLQLGAPGCVWSPLCPWGRCGDSWCGRHGPPQNKEWSPADHRTATPVNYTWHWSARRLGKQSVELQGQRETDPEWHFHIFTPPDLHLVIVCSNVLKVLLRDWEESSSKSWCSEIYIRFIQTKAEPTTWWVKPTCWCSLLYRVGFILSQLLCILGDRLPAKRQAPVKVTTIKSAVGGHWLMELKAVEVYGGDFWTNYSSGFFNDATQQGLQPTMKTLT